MEETQGWVQIHFHNDLSFIKQRFHCELGKPSKSFLSPWKQSILRISEMFENNFLHLRNRTSGLWKKQIPILLWKKIDKRSILEHLCSTKVHLLSCTQNWTRFLVRVYGLLLEHKIDKIYLQETAPKINRQIRS